MRLSASNLQPLALLIAVGMLAITITISQAWSQSSAASAGKKPKTAADRQDAASNKLQEIEHSFSAMNRKKACDLDSQCEVLEGGSRHCGGPSKLFVVSTADPKLYSQLKAKIVEYTKAEEELNKIDPPMSCTSVPAPVNAICKEGQCLSVKQ